MRKILIGLAVVALLALVPASPSAAQTVTCNGKAMTNTWTIISIGPNGLPGFPTVFLDVIGTSGADVFAPFDEQTLGFPLRISGLGGNDTICDNGLNAQDGLGGVIFGDGGNDWIDGKAGNDYIEGGSGNDYIEGGTGNDEIRGQGGDDDIYGQSGNDTLYGGNGIDDLYGASGNDYLQEAKGFVGGSSGTDTCKVTIAQITAGVVQNCETILYY